jgi:hypothetical protein
MMQDSLTLVANFVTNLFVHMTGTYGGLFYDNVNGANPASAGFVTFTTTSQGNYSGRVTVDGNTYQLAGSFSDNQDGTASSSAEVSDSGPLEVNLTLNTDTSGLLTGDVGTNDQSWDSLLTGEKTAYAPLKAPAATYNLVVSNMFSDNTGPDGYGYGTATVSKSGNVALIMHLADSGGTFSFSTSTAADGTCPFFAPLYSGQSRGIILGWLVFHPEVTSSIEASNVVWYKPASTALYYPNGFTNNALTIIGCRYVPPIARRSAFWWTVGDAAFGGDNLGGNVDNPFVYNPWYNLFSFASDGNPNSVIMSVVPSTGMVGGTFMTSQGTLATFHGVLLNRSDILPLPAAFGFFLNSDESGYVLIKPD